MGQAFHCLLYTSSYKTQLAKVYPAPAGYGAEFEKLYQDHFGNR